MECAGSSDETEQICESTVELIKSFQQMLLNAKSKHAQAKKPPPIPCQNANGRIHMYDRFEQQNRVEQHTVMPKQHNALCSNVSNLESSQPGRVVTSPSEIRLLLRLESWLGDKGVLVVRPSVHHEASGGTSDSSVNLTVKSASKQQTVPLVASPQAPEDTGAFEEEPVAVGGDGGCVCDSGERELLLKMQQQQLLLRSLGKCHGMVGHLQAQSAQAAALKSSTTNMTPAACSKPRLHQHQLLQRRERLLMKRPVLPGAGSAAASVASAKSNGVAGVGVGGGGRVLRRGEPDIDIEPERGETMSLIRKLHKLLSAELKQ